MSSKKSAPLCDAVVYAVSRLVDDAQANGKREPSHSEIEFQILRAGLSAGDPNTTPGHPPLGKMKRLRATLSWAMENNLEGGEQLIVGMLDLIRTCGGFRTTSPNYVGSEPIMNAVNAFRSEGHELSSDGELRTLDLEALDGVELTEALEAYVRRAKRGVADAALLTGTGKDLLEATAAHVVKERYGHDPGKTNFPTLLEGAFMAVGMETTSPAMPNERGGKRLERAMYEAGCAVNKLRNKEGTGHGKPWVSSMTEVEARAAIELIGCIAERLLNAHKEVPRR